MNRRFLLCVVIGLTVGLISGQLLIEEPEWDILEEEPDLVISNEPTTRMSYEGNQLWRTSVIKEDERKLITELGDKDHLSIWGGSRSNLDILIKPNSLNQVEEALRTRNISYEIVIRNLQSAINEENPPIPIIFDDRKGHRMTWNAYHRADDIFGFLDFLAQTYPDLCTVTTIGKTHEGRPIKVLKISNGKPSNKAVWIDGGIHAREWVSSATATYIINHLISNYENEPAYMQNVDFYIAPLLNPDGYEYTHTVDRLWRKNVGQKSDSSGTCFGTDLNRNFGYKWGTEGVSKNPCKDIYGGTGPFSEPESLAVKKFIEETPAKWKAYISFHSYGQFILYPWGYTRAVTPDYHDLIKVGRQAAEAIRQVGGPNYTVGPAAYTLYPAAGGSDDWAKGTMHMKYSYTIELRDNGRFGFILPANYINACGIDALAAVRVIVEAAEKI